MGESVRNGLGEAWTMIATFVPRFVGFLVILLIGWLIAKGVAKALRLLLHKAGFPRLIERTGLAEMLSRSRVDLGELLVKLVYYFILLITLQLAFSVFGSNNPVSRLLHAVIAYIPRVVVALVLVLVAAAIGRVVRDLITSALAGRSYAHLLGTLALAFLVALGVIAALNQLGIAVSVTLPVLITVLATIGGVIIVGVGGGLVRPMQQRWSTWLDRFEREAESAKSSSSRHTASRSGAPSTPAAPPPTSSEGRPTRSRRRPESGDTDPSGPGLAPS